ncbi:MAG: hypothetical protein QOJ70_3267 [Acidobacteriota bacterium]|jgi:hypothetical protein|nr:hypothetical protein [Acidobacteriota bacterium]
MKISRVVRPLAALAVTLALCAVAFADTIRMKDGQVIRGQIVGFRDQQFTVLIGSGGRGGRRSRVTLYMEDVESIEFDSANGADNASAGDNGSGSNAPIETTRTQLPAPRPSETPRQSEPRREESRQQQTGQRPPVLGNGDTGSPSNSGRTTNTGSGSTTNTVQTPARSGGGDSPFFPVRVRVRADNAANGWTDSGLMVRKGQRLRITATGRVSLGEGRFSTPTGLPRVVDTEKLMRNEPTGTLIAVIGDDNDEFIAVGANREFYAPRDGRLFLGVNEGKLEDNTGSYDALIEVEPVTSGGGGER